MLVDLSAGFTLNWLEEGCLRCGSHHFLENEDSYCLNCLCSYRRYFRRWPHLSDHTAEIFNAG